MGSKSNPQDALAVAEETLVDLDDLELVESGAPLPFEVGGSKFALRQPEPHEYELIRLWEEIGKNIALLEPDMDKMATLPVSKETQRARQERLDHLRQQIVATQDGNKRRELDQQIRRLEKPDTRTRDEEMAESFSYRYRDIQMIKRFLVQPDGSPVDKQEVDRLLRVSVFVDIARIACYRIIKIMLALPNWIERPAYEPS